MATHMGIKSKRKGIQVCVYLIHFAEKQKPQTIEKQLYSKLKK